MPGWDDILKGSNANDILIGGAGDDFLQGRAGDDVLDGGDGNDQIHGDSGDDQLKGGRGNDLITGGADGVDTAWFVGDAREYTHSFDGDNLYLFHLGGAGDDGNDWLKFVERLAFADAIIDLRVNNAPIAYNDVAAVGEDDVSHSRGAGGGVLANDFDWEGDAMSATAGTFTGAYGTLTLNADGSYTYVLSSAVQPLAQGQTVTDSFSYIVSDGSLTDTGTLTITITGVNDPPVANPDTATTSENAAVDVDVLANDTDIDIGAVLTVTAASAPAGQGSASVVGNQVRFDPGTDFDYLAQGESVVVQISYMISDEFGGTSSSTVGITVTGTNDVPVANPDTATTGENTALLIDVVANDTDVDNGAVLTLVSASGPAGQGSVSMDGNQVRFDPGSDFETLAQGATATVTISYTIEDEHGASASSSAEVTVTGVNDPPVANPDSASTTENAAVLIDVLANDTDIDNGAVLTVTAASAPAGEGSASVVGNQVRFDPGTDFDHLAEGATATVIVSYTMADEHGGTSASTVEILVTGTNDGPVAHPDSASTSENAVLTIDVVANDTDADDGALLFVTGATVPDGQGSVFVEDNQVHFDPGTDFDHLALGESAQVVVSYTIEDEYGVPSASTVTITVNGRDEGAANTGTNAGETITGTNGNDTIDALGGDDTVFGLAGDDLITGGDGRDQLLGEGDNDVIEGGADNDFAFGGDGDDQLFGQADNDTLVGEEGNDQLSGGTGFDFLAGEAGDDVILGGADDDTATGGDGHDQMSGEAGNDLLYGDSGDDQVTGGTGDDSLEGGDGDDTLDGGDGNDFLSGSGGVNALTGGLGDDTFFADSTGGIQTISGGDGNDTIRHYYRYAASTITTGSGRDTIDLVHANLFSDPATAIVVTDFTAGAGGDVVELMGPDSAGALLSLLSGWDGSTNPFDAGFLRLTQDGADTLLEWDQDGAGTGSDWQALIVFENTDAADFTDANFSPGYSPGGGAPGGQTITGTNLEDVLTGTVGDDTIDALDGDDFVSGGGGADTIQGGGGSDFVAGGGGGDTIDGGDGADSLSGDEDDDILHGGNDDDSVLGGEGADQLTGDAGNDILLAENGNDQATGGLGDDTLEGGDGDDTLDGGDGNDYVAGGLGTNALTGGSGDDFIFADSTDGAQTVLAGDGNDTIRHFYRYAGSTITTGAGRDTIELVHADLFSDPATAIVVTDFTAGAGGDVFRLVDPDNPGLVLSLLSGWDGSSNPFGAGFLRLTQDGADTLLEWDQDGAGTGSDWQPLVVFENTDAADFTDANFDPGYDPDGGAPAGRTITGSNADDALTGTVGADTIDALDGDDFVLGGTGGDTIRGGGGFDHLRGEADNDVIEGGLDDDQLWGGDGDDQLSGQAGNDVVFGESGEDQLTGGDGDDNLEGGDGDDTITGGNGTDFLAGDLGADMLTGGAGTDYFHFRSASHGPDQITDFVRGIDLILISADGFGGGLIAGGTVSLVSGANPTASQASGQFLYDTDDGRLLWDVDGTGSEGAVLLATFTNVPTLAASDFFVGT